MNHGESNPYPPPKTERAVNDRGSYSELPLPDSEQSARTGIPEDRRPPAPDPASERSATPPQRPSVGRVVHFWKDGKTGPFAATITKVWSDDLVNLAVFSDGSFVFGPNVAILTSVQYHDYAPAGADSWSWPERV